MDFVTLAAMAIAIAGWLTAWDCKKRLDALDKAAAIEEEKWRELAYDIERDAHA